MRQDRAAMEQDARWIYNDVERGFAEAGRTGKPLLVVLRCVPCLSCVGLDASVLTEPELAPLLDQFVLVRHGAPPMRHPYQHHARKAHSVFWVFRRKGSRVASGQGMLV